MRKNPGALSLAKALARLPYPGRTTERGGAPSRLSPFCASVLRRPKEKGILWQLPLQIIRVQWRMMAVCDASCRSTGAQIRQQNRPTPLPCEDTSGYLDLNINVVK
jgi:hypothetical protein